MTGKVQSDVLSAAGSVIVTVALKLRSSSCRLGSGLVRAVCSIVVPVSVVALVLVDSGICVVVACMAGTVLCTAAVLVAVMLMGVTMCTSMVGVDIMVYGCGCPVGTSMVGVAVRLLQMVAAAGCRSC